MCSTKDQDNNINDSQNYVAQYRAGYWYSNYHCANPNGEYKVGFSGGVSQGYEAWTGWYSLKSIGRFIVRRVELVHAQYLQNI